MATLSLDFLAGLAHELRTPLGGIGGYAELLALGVQGPVTAAQADALQRIQANQKGLVALIDAFMAYSESALGDAATELGDTAIRDAVDRAVAASGRNAARRSARIMVDPIDSTLTITTVQARFVDAIRLLLLDAIESAPEGSEVRVSVAVSGADLTVTVRSDGQPVEGAAREAAFIPFDRDGRGDRQSGALHALALPHARLIGRQLGGDVLAQAGSARTLQFSLPLDR